MRATAELLVLDEPVRLDAPTGLTGQTAENNKSADSSNSKGKAEVADWRVSIVAYLKDPGNGAERSIWHLNTLWTTMSFIVEPPKIYFSSA